jgi:hypothetical protein
LLKRSDGCGHELVWCCHSGSSIGIGVLFHFE